MLEADRMVYHIEEVVDLMEEATLKEKVDDGTRILTVEDDNQSKVLVALGEQVIVINC